MIESTFKGNKYRYCKSDRGNYWIGANRSLGGGWGTNYYPGNNCTAPRCIWGELQQIAITSGISPDEFITKREEKPVSKTVSKKNKKPSISIF